MYDFGGFYFDDFFEEYISFWPSVDMGWVGPGGKEAEQHNIM